MRRALLRDPNGKFANVSDARLALKSVLSEQEAPTGGAAALKALAETFGRHAAALEAKAAAEAAEKARKAALAAQAALREALQEQADNAAAAVPLSGLVPAFTLLRMRGHRWRARHTGRHWTSRQRHPASPTRPSAGAFLSRRRWRRPSRRAR